MAGRGATEDLASRLAQRVVPAVPVPFTAGGALDGPAQAAYVSWMAGQPVAGVAVWAHTGRGLWLTADQREQVLATWRAGAPALAVVCGVGVPRTASLPASPRARTDRVLAHTVRAAEAAREGGAAAVLVHPPTALRELEDAAGRVVALHEAVAGVGLPVLAFWLYEAAGGIAYAAPTVERLLALDGVIGIKIATLDSIIRFQELVPVVEACGALLVTGEDRFLGYSLLLGSRAALIGVAAACTDRSAALLDAWFTGSLGRFVELSRELDRFAGATFVPPMDGYVQRLLWALEADGVLPGRTFDPFGPALAPGERDRVVQAVRALRAA